jgi:hypothetical protein
MTRFRIPGVQSSVHYHVRPFAPREHRTHPLFDTRMATVGNIVMWALLTGGITGGVWVSIVLLANHGRLRAEQRQLGAAIEARREELALLEQRLSMMEQRQAELAANTIRDGRLESPTDH